MSVAKSFAILTGGGVLGWLVGFSIIAIGHITFYHSGLFAVADDPNWISLANLGGFACFALTMVLLHKDAIKRFHEEMQEERKLFRDTIGGERLERTARDREFQMCMAMNHKEAMEILRKIDGKGSDIKDAIDGLHHGT